MNNNFRRGRFFIKRWKTIPCSLHSSSNSVEAITQKLYTGKDGSDFIAYRKFSPLSPSSDIGVLFCQGLLSNMNRTKSRFLERYCKVKRLNYVCFDYMGHGESSGKFEDFTIGLWKNNTLDILNKITKGPQVIVGSSIGGWIMLLAALGNPAKVHGLLGIASAPDLLYHSWYDDLPDQEKHRIQRNGYFVLPTDSNGEPIQLPFSVITDAKQNLMLNKDEIEYDGPVHLIHGQNDATVPVSYSTKISQKLRTNNVFMHLIKDGDHQLSRDSDLNFLSCILDHMIFS